MDGGYDAGFPAVRASTCFRGNQKRPAMLRRCAGYALQLRDRCLVLRDCFASQSPFALVARLAERLNLMRLVFRDEVRITIVIDIVHNLTYKNGN